MKTSTQTWILFLSLLLITATGCINGRLVTFDFQRSATFVIPTGASTNVILNYNIEDLSPDYSAEAEANGVSQEDAVDLYLRSLALELVSPRSRTLDFISSGEIYINAPGRPEILVGRLTSAPFGAGQVIDFEPTTEPVLNHFNADSYSFRLALVFDQLVLQESTVRLLQAYRVSIDEE
jgi:hypothetical protein